MSARWPATKRNASPEKDFRKAAMQWLEIRFHGVIWRVKILGGLGQRPGVPDDLFCIRGIFCGIEWKAPGKGRIGPKQAIEIEAIRAAGGRAGVVSSWGELEELVKDLEPVQRGMKDAIKKPPGV